MSTEKQLQERIESLSHDANGELGVSASEVVALATHARELVGQGRSDCAAVILRALTELDSENPSHYVCLGALAIETESWDDAEQSLRRAVELDQSSTAGRLHLAEALIGRGDERMAEAELRRTAELDSRGEDRFANRARVLLNRLQETKVAARAGGSY